MSIAAADPSAIWSFVGRLRKYSIFIQNLSSRSANFTTPVPENSASDSAGYQKTAQGEWPGCRSHYGDTQAHSDLTSKDSSCYTEGQFTCLYILRFPAVLLSSSGTRLLDLQRRCSRTQRDAQRRAFFQQLCRLRNPRNRFAVPLYLSAVQIALGRDSQHFFDRTFIGLRH